MPWITYYVSLSVFLGDLLYWYNLRAWFTPNGHLICLRVAEWARPFGVRLFADIGDDGSVLPQVAAENLPVGYDVRGARSNHASVVIAIDNGYRDEKQNMGLHKYQMRKGNGILKHAELVFTVHSMLPLINANRPLRQRLQTVGEICRWLKTLRDRENAKWIYEKAAAGEPLPDILEALGLA